MVFSPCCQFINGEEISHHEMCSIASCDQATRSALTLLLEPIGSRQRLRL
jgi:hypothetical protein